VTEPSASQPDVARLTWVGHSTVRLDIGGCRLLTDPLLRRRVAHLRRRCERPSSDVADVDIVLLSHAHMDHLHVPSLRDVNSAATVIAPRGTRALLERAGFEAIAEVVEGDRIELAPAVIEVIEAVHPCGRGPHSSIAAAPVGYVIDIGGHRTYFAGDTDLFDGMIGLGSIDVALLPVWGWGSTIGEGHLDPERAVEATRLIRPDIVVPIHWGTYSPEDGRRRPPYWLDDPAERFSVALARAGLSDRLRTLRPGDDLDLRSGSTPSA